LKYKVYTEEAACDVINLICTDCHTVETDSVLCRYNDTVFVVLYSGYVIVAETVSRLTFHGSRDTAVDGKVMFAQFVLMGFNLQVEFRLLWLQ
jgi:hypothetical protein